MEAAPTVPVFEALDKIYEDVEGSLKEKHEARYVNMIDRFKKHFGMIPHFYARAPGRVNIIGEHIDYCGYSVLPAAIEQDFIMAVATDNSDEITIANIDEVQFEKSTIANDPFQKLKDTAHWLNYFLCGYKAVLSLDDELRKSVEKPKGLKIFIDSIVPPAAGLSSSSAFTVCSALVAMHANGLTNKIPQTKLADLCVQAERMAGTACGGMD